MHTEVMHWVRTSLGEYRDVVRSVIEIGSQDINGSPRSVFAARPEMARYVGIDVFDRPGVDWVGLAHDFPATGWDGELFDALVTTEALEHDPYWRRSLAACLPLVRPGGLVVVTCGTMARSPHGVEHDTPTPGHYGNVGKAELLAALADSAVDATAIVDRGNQDLCARGMRRDAGACLAALGAFVPGGAAATLDEYTGVLRAARGRLAARAG